MLKINSYKLGIFYGKDPDTEKLAAKFTGHLINYLDFCNACNDSEKNFYCCKCRKYLSCNANNIYFYEKIDGNLNSVDGSFINILLYKIPIVDFLLVIGIDKNVLSKLPEVLKNSRVKAVIIPIENPKWVPPELQVRLLSEFEKQNIQAAFPKPFCSLSKEENQYNRKGFHTTENRNYIDEFIEFFKIGIPIISFLMTDDCKTIKDARILQSAPCGSTFYIIQQLKSRFLSKRKNKSSDLTEVINRAYKQYPCCASKEKDHILENSIFHISSQILRNIIRCELYLAENKNFEPSIILEETLRKQRIFQQL